jgi:N-acetyl-alpha-D-glucosaminyl L-malate synthase BshA
MAEVSRSHGLDVLHVHYAVPHATAAILAQSMLPPGLRPRLVTTLHGTDTTLLGRDAGYGPAITHALERSDAVTTVSAYLERETRQLLGVTRPIDVIHNFFEPRAARRGRDEVRRELGIGAEAMVLHLSNLRPLKRIDLLLECAARIRPRESFKLVILAGADFSPFAADVRRLGLEDRVIVREHVTDIEDYLQAADIGLFASDMESFCLSLLETMCFSCPSVATAVGGIPEVAVSGSSGLLVPAGDADALARGVETLIRDPAQRAALGAAARKRARELFSADAIVPLYERLYRRICETGRAKA